MRKLLLLITFSIISFASFAQFTAVNNALSRQNSDTSNIRINYAGTFGFGYIRTSWGNDQRYVRTGSAGYVTSFNTRTGAVVPLSGDYSSFYPLLSGSYANPSWITSLALSKVTGLLDSLSNKANKTFNNVAAGALPILKIAPGSNGQVLTTTGGVAAWGAGVDPADFIQNQFSALQTNASFWINKGLFEDSTPSVEEDIIGLSNLGSASLKNINIYSSARYFKIGLPTSGYNDGAKAWVTPNNPIIDSDGKIVIRGLNGVEIIGGGTGAGGTNNVSFFTGDYGNPSYFKLNSSTVETNMNIEGIGSAAFEISNDTEWTGLLVANTGVSGFVKQELRSDEAKLSLAVNGSGWDGGHYGNIASIAATHGLWLTGGSGNVKINSSLLSIGDEYTFPGSDGTSGQVLTTDGSGVVTWEDAGGSVDSTFFIRNQHSFYQPSIFKILTTTDTGPGNEIKATDGDKILLTLTDGDQKLTYSPTYGLKVNAGGANEIGLGGNGVVELPNTLNVGSNIDVIGGIESGGTGTFAKSADAGYEGLIVRNYSSGDNAYSNISIEAGSLGYLKLFSYSENYDSGIGTPAPFSEIASSGGLYISANLEPVHISGIYGIALRGADGTDWTILKSSSNDSQTILLPSHDGTLATLAGTETLTNKTLTSPIMTTPTLGVASATALNITGTGGAGFVALIPQSSPPSTPVSGVRLYSRSTGAFSWIGTNGFTRSIVASITADRVYTLPDFDGTFTMDAGTSTLTNKTLTSPIINVASDATGDIYYRNSGGAFTRLPIGASTTVLHGGTTPSYSAISLTADISGVLPVANGGTNASSASITAFNNITGYTASGATGTTSTNLVFSASPTFTGTAIAATLSYTALISTSTNSTINNVNTTSGNVAGGITMRNGGTINGSGSALTFQNGAGTNSARIGNIITGRGTATDVDIVFSNNTGGVLTEVGRLTDQGNWNIAGGLRLNYVAKTTTYSILSNDYYIDCTTGTFTATLPTAVGIAGKTYCVVNSGAGVITIATTSSQTINGVSTDTLTAGIARNYTSNGANWFIN